MKAEGRNKCEGKQRTSASSFLPSAFILLPSFLRRLHRNDRGNIGVLLLLTIWALVAVLALVWNTGEVSARKQNLQTAADTTAQSTAAWMSRAVNMIAAQNMIIGQDASMETIWRAVTPADTSVRNRLERELARASDPTQQNFQTQLTQEMIVIDDRYNEALTALAQVNAAAANDPSADAAFKTSIQQSSAALANIQNTVVPQLMAQWQSTVQGQPPPAIAAIIASLKQQLVILGQFEAQTASAGPLPPDQQDASTMVQNTHAHQATVYQNEQNMIYGDIVDDPNSPDRSPPSPLPVPPHLNDVIRQQREQQANFYNVGVATDNGGSKKDYPTPGMIAAPAIPAAWITSQPHFDSIRGEEVQIDPINVQCDNTGTADEDTDVSPTTQPTGTVDARIIYPDVVVPLPADLLALFPRMSPTVSIHCTIGGGWGHLYCAPLYRYVTGRVGRDEQGLNVYMQEIDALRQQLSGLTQGASVSAPTVPRLTAPANAGGDLRAAIQSFNLFVTAYNGALGGLTSGISAFLGPFTRPFAVATWTGTVDHWRRVVLKALGVSKQFMVLAPYNLQPIPDWAQRSMYASAESAVRTSIHLRLNNDDRIAQQMIRSLRAPPTLDQIRKASEFAVNAVEQAANEAAPAIAREWISRPWAYEITPPDQAVPPTVGMTKPDRQEYFTLLAAAKPTDANTPKLFMAKLMGNPTIPQLLAHAQAETFNWNEFNGAYGGGEMFDQVTWGTDSEFVGAPIPWRVSTTGGWNWQPRLALSDALGPALQNNSGSELSSFFQGAGLNGDNQQAIDTLTLH